MILELRTKRQIQDHLLWLLLEVSGLVSVDKNLASACKALASMCGTVRGERERGKEGWKERGEAGQCPALPEVTVHILGPISDIIRGQELKATPRPFCLA